jgi:hypothetical protein
VSRRRGDTERGRSSLVGDAARGRGEGDRNPGEGERCAATILTPGSVAEGENLEAEVVRCDVLRPLAHTCHIL